MVLCGNGSFPPLSKDEDSVPTGSKKAFLDEKCAGRTEQAEVGRSARRAISCL
jgi:hypothetical protein